MKLLEKKHRGNLDLNTNIQMRKDFRNPRWVDEGAYIHCIVLIF